MTPEQALQDMQKHYQSEISAFNNSGKCEPKGEALEQLCKTVLWYKLSPTDDGIMLPHMGVLLNTIKGFRIVSIITRPEWRKNDAGFYYCHPTYYIPGNGWLPKKSKKYSDETNFVYGLRFAELSHRLISGDKTYHITRYNCQTFSEAIINGFGETSK